MKCYFRSLSLDKKNTKTKFEKVVRETVGYISRKISKCSQQGAGNKWWHIHTSTNNNDKCTSYVMLVCFVKVSKMHQNIGAQEKGFIKKFILDSISVMQWNAVEDDSLDKTVILWYECVRGHHLYTSYKMYRTVKNSCTKKSFSNLCTFVLKSYRWWSKTV